MSETDWAMLAKQVLAYADPDGECLIWQGAVTPSGRAYLADTLAVEVVYRAAYGDIPRGHRVEQTCGHLLCMRPRHLSCTPLTLPKLPGAKKLPEHIREIRRLWSLEDDYGKRTTTLAKLAKEFDLSVPSVRSIVRGRTWTFLP